MRRHLVTGGAGFIGSHRADVVVCVEGFYGMGGTERQATTIALELLRRGVAVAFLSRWPLSSDNTYVRELRAAGVPLISRGWVGPGTSPLNRWRVHLAKAMALGREAELVKAAWQWEQHALERHIIGRPVLHEVPFFGLVPPAGRAALEVIGLPVVHSTFGSPTEGSLVPATRRAVLTSDGSPCQDQRFRFVPTMSPGVRSLPLAITPPTEPRILFAGRMERSKGVDVLIEAVARIGKVELRLAGEGSELPRLRELANRHGVNATFLGRLDQLGLAQEFARSHVVAVPSLPSELGEGVPTVIGEALAAGTQVVASTTGGIPYLKRVVGETHVLSLVPPGSIDILATELASAVRRWDPALPDECRQLHEKFLSPSAVMPYYLEAYDAARERTEAK